MLSVAFFAAWPSRAVALFAAVDTQAGPVSAGLLVAVGGDHWWSPKSKANWSRRLATISQ